MLPWDVAAKPLAGLVTITWIVCPWLSCHLATVPYAWSVSGTFPPPVHIQTPQLQFWTWRLSHCPTALALMCLSLISKRLSIFCLFVCFVFILSHSVLSQCPAHLACWKSLSTSNWQTPDLVVKVLFSSHFFCLSVTLCPSVFVSVALLPRETSLLLSCLIVLFVSLNPAGFVPLFLVWSSSFVGKGKTCKELIKTLVKNTHGGI